MAKLPPKKSEENTGEWLNTYADMVTLLLTFFVLLFSCSNLDETKMQYIFQAFQSRGKFMNTAVAELDPVAEGKGGVTDDGPQQTGSDGEMPQSFDELYVYLAEFVKDNNLADKVAVEKGAAHITIRFQDSVFFDGGSYMLKQQGKETLDKIIPGLKAVHNTIRTLTISGHTADDGTDKTGDFVLSANRSNSVYLHLKNRETIEFEKYRIKASGPNEPLEPNDSLENMAKNRRVEITLLRNELDLTDPKVIEDILKYDFRLGSEQFDPESQKPKDPEALPEGSVDKIIDTIKDRFEVDSSGISMPMWPGIIDSGEFVVDAAESGTPEENPDEQTSE